MSNEAGSPAVGGDRVATKKAKNGKVDEEAQRRAQAAQDGRTASRVRLTAIEFDPAAADPSNARGYGKGKIDLEATDPDFLDSVKQHGVIEPVILIASGKHDKFKLAAGARRITAAYLTGLVDVPAIILPEGTTQIDAAFIGVVENAQRADLKPAEMAYGLHQIKQMSKKEGEGKGLTNSDIAKRVGLSEGLVGNYIRFCEKLIPEILRAWRGELGVSLTMAQIEPFATLKPEEQKAAWKEFIADTKKGDDDGDSEGGGDKSPGDKPKKMVRREKIEDVLRALRRKNFADHVSTVLVLTPEDGLVSTEAGELDEEVRYAMIGLLEWVVGKRKKDVITYPEAEEEEDEE